MSPVEVVLRGARALLGDPRDRKIEAVDIRIAGGVISEIGAGLDAGHAEVVDYSGCWIIPGFVDAHQHVWQAVLRGRLADLPHEESEAVVRDLVAHAVAPADVYAGAYGGAIAMLDAGITCTFDHCDAVATVEHGRAAVHGLHDAGIRGVWGYGFDSAGSEAGPEQRLDDARRLKSLIDGYPLLSFGVVPYADDDPERFAAQIALGAETDAAILTHTDARRRGEGPADSETWLKAGLVSARHVHAFCSATPASVFGEFARLGCSVVSTPDIELGGGLGYTALHQADDAGVNTALGTGSQAVSSPDMFATMRLGMQSERMRYQQAAAVTRGTSGISRITLRTEEMLHFATLGGARALGLGDVCGSIEVGKAADLVVIRPASPRLAPLVDPMVSIVMHMGVADIDAVLVGGEFRKKNGALTGDAAVRAMNELDAAHARIASAVSGRMKEVSV
ncbi:amidohydrolase family protein [Thermopolyspora sp. NPDC052614]|uniref:amidohydrolase family protein n=1 Tax=Thermopolyspora sp. NPDC052614 TaxID=3155682 RepID=UPI003438928C